LSQTEVALGTRPKIFYGWLVVCAAAVSYFLSGGARQGGFGNFLKPISDEFGWSRALTAGAASLGSVESAVQGPIIGVMIDRYGPRLIMWGGFAIGAVGFLILSFVNGIALFYLVYVIMIPLGLGAVQLAGQTVVAQWFIRRRSRALSILTLGVATGGAVLTPAIGWLVTNHGWRTSSVVLALLVGIVGIAAVSLIKNRPEDHGLRPDGDLEPAAGTASPGVATQQAEADFSVRRALRTRAFWLLTAGSMFTQLATSAVSIHAIPLITDRGFSEQSAANYVGLTFFWGIVGRLMWGFLGDFVGKRYLLAIATVVQGIGIFFLANFTGTRDLYLYAAFYGLGQAIVPVQFAIRAEYFGRKAFASIAGMMSFFTTIGGVVGPIYAGRSYDITGSYELALFIVGGGLIAGAFLFFFATRPPPPAGATVAS
jgi:MFS family permease